VKGGRAAWPAAPHLHGTARPSAREELPLRTPGGAAASLGPADDMRFGSAQLPE